MFSSRVWLPSFSSQSKSFWPPLSHSAVFVLSSVLLYINSEITSKPVGCLFSAGEGPLRLQNPPAGDGGAAEEVQRQAEAEGESA